MLSIIPCSGLFQVVAALIHNQFRVRLHKDLAVILGPEWMEHAIIVQRALSMLYWQSLGYGAKDFTTFEIDRYGDYLERSELNLKLNKTSLSPIRRDNTYGVLLNDLLREASNHSISDVVLARNTALVAVVVKGYTIETRIEGYTGVFVGSMSDMLVPTEEANGKCTKFNGNWHQYEPLSQGLKNMYMRYMNSKNPQPASSPRSNETYFKYRTEDDLKIINGMASTLKCIQKRVGVLNSECVEAERRARQPQPQLGLFARATAPIRAMHGKSKDTKEVRPTTPARFLHCFPPYIADID